MSLWNRFCNAAIAVGIVVVAVSFVSPGVSAGQAQETAAAPEASPEIHAVLEKIVHPKKVKVGDQVVARLTESTKLKDGTELPKGSHVLGKVTELKVKADKEGPSKLGILFDKAELKDAKEMPLSMALVSLAPRYEPGSVDPVAAENTASGAGRISQMSQAQGRTEGSAGSDTLSKGLGIRGASSVSLEAMRPGVCYVPDITIASYSMGEPGTIFQSTKTTVYLDSGSRLLLLAQ